LRVFGFHEDKNMPTFKQAESKECQRSGRNDKEIVKTGKRSSEWIKFSMEWNLAVEDMERSSRDD
jgi:hypothetical protein